MTQIDVDDECMKGLARKLYLSIPDDLADDVRGALLIVHTDSCFRPRVRVLFRELWLKFQDVIEEERNHVGN